MNGGEHPFAGSSVLHVIVMHVWQDDDCCAATICVHALALVVTIMTVISSWRHLVDMLDDNSGNLGCNHL
jgi:hypothetical protein